MPPAPGVSAPRTQRERRPPTPRGPARPAPPSTLSALRRELSSPAALRRAVLLHEILGPPKGFD